MCRVWKIVTTKMALFGVLGAFLLLFQSQKVRAQPTWHPQFGLNGYISNSSVPGPAEFADYNMGFGFYVAQWQLTSNPVSSFQIGLPSTWLIPDNSDNTTLPLCPVGTTARDNWSHAGPTFSHLFQTVEGGPGYWNLNRFHYGPPKYSMNSTSDCYSSQIGSPGWSFFFRSNGMPDHLLTIAQLSNRLLIPPDGMTFQGEPKGEFLGTSYLALPFTEAKTNPVITGENSWTLFFASKNFNGPIAFFVPDSWSQISINHEPSVGRGLDSKPLRRDLAAGTFEIGRAPFFSATDDEGDVYTKVPLLRFPVDENGDTKLVRDVSYYSRDALFNDVLNWREGGDLPSGKLNETGIYHPKTKTFPNQNLRQQGERISGIEEQVSKHIYDDGAFGFKWHIETENGIGKFPQYFKDVGDTRIPVSPEDVPEETGLLEAEFPKPNLFAEDFYIDLEGAWTNPGPVSGPYEAVLADKSTVTYYWYRFIDQPVFQRFDWSEEEKNRLQAMVEQLHEHWTIEKQYLKPISQGELVSLDPGLIVTPPSGLEYGYVPLVVRQSRSCENLIQPVLQITELENGQVRVTASINSDFDLPIEVNWSDGTFGSSATFLRTETYRAGLITDRCHFTLYSPPVAYAASGTTEDSFVANWKGVLGVKDYQVDVAYDQDFSRLVEGWEGKEVLGKESIKVILPDPISDKYYYRVRAVGSQKEISTNSEAITVNLINTSCDLVLQIEKQNLSDKDAADGSAMVLVEGGTAPYLYQWSTGENSASVDGLEKGNYEVIVTDANGCSASANVSIGLPIGSNSIGNRVWHDLNQNGIDDFGEPGIPGVLVALWQDIDGDGIPDWQGWRGWVETDESGFYRFDQLGPGVYGVFVWEIDNWKPNGPLNGMISTKGGIDPDSDVDFDNNGQGQPWTNLFAKPLTLTVGGEPLHDGDPEDENYDYDPSGNMTVDFGFYRAEAICPVINATISGSEIIYMGFQNGTLTVEPVSGEAPYSFLWSTGSTEQTVEGLPAGEYSVTITDNNGCTGEAHFEIKSQKAPAHISASPYLWLMTDTTESQDVSLEQWSDRIGYVSLTTDAANPSFTTGPGSSPEVSTGAINFNNAVQFNRSVVQSEYLATFLTDFPTEEIMQFMVVTSESRDGPLWTFSTEAHPRALAIYSHGIDYGGVYHAFNEALDLSTPQLLTLTISTENNELSLFLNGQVDPFFSTTVTSLTQAGYFLLGQHSEGFGGLFDHSKIFEGQIAEFLLYRNVLSSSDRRKMESYLAIKYGITLDQTSPADYVASNGVVVWQAADNEEFFHDIGIIASDAGYELVQPKSKSQNPKAILTSSTKSVLPDGTFLVWASNGKEILPEVDAAQKERLYLQREWQFQVTTNLDRGDGVGELYEGDLEVEIELDLSSLSYKEEEVYLELITSNQNETQLFSAEIDEQIARFRFDTRALGSSKFGVKLVLGPSLITSVDDSPDGGIRIYPNPTEGNLVIEMDGQVRNGSLFIYDILGALMKESQVTGGKGTTVDMSHLPNGLYLIRIQLGSNVYVQKIIKER